MRTHFSVSKYNLLHYWSSVHKGPGQLKGVRRPLPVGSPIPDDRRAPGSVLGKTSVALCYESPSHRWLSLTWKRISSPVGTAATLRKRKVYTKKEYQSEVWLIMCYAKQIGVKFNDLMNNRISKVALLIQSLSPDHGTFSHDLHWV